MSIRGLRWKKGLYMFQRFPRFMVSLSLLLSAVVGCGQPKEVSSPQPKDAGVKAKFMQGERKLRADE
jgi:hypothetical protein